MSRDTNTVRWPLTHSLRAPTYTIRASSVRVCAYMCVWPRLLVAHSRARRAVLWCARHGEAAASDRGLRPVRPDATAGSMAGVGLPSLPSVHAGGSLR